MANEPEPIEYASPQTPERKTTQRSFGLDLDPSRNGKSALVLVLIGAFAFFSLLMFLMLVLH